MSKLDAVLGSQWGDEGKGKLVDTIGNQWVQGRYSITAQVRPLLPYHGRRQRRSHHHLRQQGGCLPLGAHRCRPAAGEVHHRQRLRREHHHAFRGDRESSQNQGEHREPVRLYRHVNTPDCSCRTVLTSCSTSTRSAMD